MAAAPVLLLSLGVVEVVLKFPVVHHPDFGLFLLPRFATRWLRWLRLQLRPLEVFRLTCLMLLCRFLCSYFTTISVPSNHYRDLVPVLSARKWHGIALSLSARPPCIMGSIKLLRQSVANKQALPCWPTAPSFPLQVSGHVSLTVQSLLTQTGELPNTRWLDS